MTPAQQDIEITRGDFFALFFRVKSTSTGDYRDLTGWVGRAQLRVNIDDADPLAVFGINISDQSVYPGGVLMYMDETDTGVLTHSGPGLTKQIGIWDIELTNELGEPNTFLWGNVTLRKDVTR